MGCMLAAPASRRVAGGPMQQQQQQQQHLLNGWLQQQLGLELERLQPVGGGCIHQAWQLQLRGGGQLFAKTNRSALLPVLQAEAEGLVALREAAQRARQRQGEPTLQIPEPLALGHLGGAGEDNDQAVLVLSWLELGTAGQEPDRGWRALGIGLARLHRASLEGHDGRYGWGLDNAIGASPQANGWSPSWCTFFGERRLGAQWHRAQASGQRLAGAAELLAQLPRWLGEHQPDACLVHGDLWGGNAGLLAGGGGAIFDPAVHRADREVDLAMARLFGGFPGAFFAGYEEEWPLPRGHRQRIALYNLYHLLNHANLFGGGYWSQCERSIAALLKQGPG